MNSPTPTPTNGDFFTLSFRAKITIVLASFVLVASATYFVDVLFRDEPRPLFNVLFNGVLWACYIPLMALTMRGIAKYKAREKNRMM